MILTISEAKIPEFDANTNPVLRTFLLTKNEAKTPEFDANTEPVLRIYFWQKVRQKLQNLTQTQ